MCDSLVEIPSQYWPILRDLFKVQWPLHAYAFTTLHIFIDRINKFPDSRDVIKVYSLNGDWKQNGTFIIVNDDQVMTETLDKDFKVIKNSLKLLNYSKNIYFMCLRDVFRPMMFELINEEALNVGDDLRTKCFMLSKEIANNFEITIPPGFNIRQLDDKDVEHVAALWPYAKHFSEHFIANLIKYNPNVGLLNGDDLIGWCLIYDVGALAALQVKEKHLRKGFATLLVKAITKKFSQYFNCDVLANTSYDNVKSIRLLTKLGFKEVDKNSWIVIKKH